VVLYWLALGCGGEGSKFVPVSGKVTLDGQPLPAGSISFQPDASQGNSGMHIPMSPISAGGRYELVTIGKKGAPPGWYKVLVFFNENDLPADDPRQRRSSRPKSLIEPKYTDVQTTDLVVEVVSNPASGAYDLKVSK
jgi:hypothetical protein